MLVFFFKAEGILTAEESDKITKDAFERLDAELKSTANHVYPPVCIPHREDGYLRAFASRPAVLAHLQVFPR